MSESEELQADDVMRRLASGERERSNKMYDENPHLVIDCARPKLHWGSVWCKRCNKPCEFEDTATHNARNSSRSRLYIRAECHGETADVFMTFLQYQQGNGARIDLWDDNSLPASSGERPAIGTPQLEPLSLPDVSLPARGPSSPRLE